ncbi:MAG: DUF3857 domain-containing protein [Coxiellaceae bacterium]|jgi:hypothetical protein|nr:DUF3857 domain-containing protein [Coxiellaceae bacterium]
MQKLVLSTILWIILLNPVYAKWANITDAPTKTSLREEIFINADGTYKTITEINKEILTETGRSPGFGTTLYYNGDSEKIEILEAKTIYKGREYFLDKNSIEDKPLASPPEGFDQKKQILLAFPKTEVGAKLYVKYKFDLNKPPLENSYAAMFNFGYLDLDTNAQIKIHSKLPLNILVNDPEHHLKITQTKTKDIHHIEIVLKKPIYKVATNELGPFIINPKHLTWVSISNLNKWEDLVAKYGKLIAKVFTQKLPHDFVIILEKAKRKTNDIDRINTVTSLLNDKIRYMGDWRSVSGRFVPRDLDKISKTQIGDCKDFAASTAAILTKLGYKAQIIAVARGIAQVSLPILPNIYAFNHAMVKVTNKKGTVYWIDPTNFESMADGIFPDIANKMVLILDPNNPGYEQIPPINPHRAKTHLTRSFEILNNNKIIETGNLTLTNEATLGLIGAALKVSDEMIKNEIFYTLADRTILDERNKKKMQLPKLNSRVVKDIVLAYSFERENDILLTNIGPALKLTYTGPISTIYNISQDNVADTLIDSSPYTSIRQTIIKNVGIKNIESLNKEIKTPWIYVKRSCSLNQNDNLQIDDIITVHQNLIPKEDFRKQEFITLKNWLKTNFKDIILVFEPIEGERKKTQ